MEQHRYFFSFDNVTSDEANVLASDLRESVLDIIPDATVTRMRENPLAQDFGATLAIVLGAPAIVRLATALGSWIQAQRGVGVTIKNSNGELIATNVTGKDAKELAAMFLDQK